MGQWVYIYSKLNFIVSTDNSSFKKRFNLVVNIRPEAEWSNHEQVEDFVETHVEGLNSCLLKKIGMTCG